MATKQAKDFLVQQVAAQAARENVPLSDVEKRMMYFTESDATSCDNPAELNDEFEAQHDTATFEAKMSQLLHNAYDRLKAENPEGKRNWDQAIRTLRRGDHYLLVLWDRKARPQHDSLKLFGTALLIVACLVTAILLAAKYNIDMDRYGKYLFALLVVMLALAMGMGRDLYRMVSTLFHRGRAGEDDSN